jgi:DNA primase
MPVRWSNLDLILPTDFTIENVPKLVAKKTEVWEGVITEKQNIGKIIERAREI